MIEYLPYFAGFITLMFGFAFYLGFQEFKKLGRREPSNTSQNASITDNKS